jgi:hypothetical protein
MCPQRAAENLAEELSQWQGRARSAWQPFFFAEMRFRTFWGDAELMDNIQNVRRWLVENPCPDDSVRRHFEGMLNAYTEMASASVPRLMELRDEIEQHTKVLWQPESSLRHA